MKSHLSSCTSLKIHKWVGHNYLKELKVKIKLHKFRCRLIYLLVSQLNPSNPSLQEQLPSTLQEPPFKQKKFLLQTKSEKYVLFMLTLSRKQVKCFIRIYQCYMTSILTTFSTYSMVSNCRLVVCRPLNVILMIVPICLHVVLISSQTASCWKLIIVYNVQIGVC